MVTPNNRKALIYVLSVYIVWPQAASSTGELVWEEGSERERLLPWGLAVWAILVNQVLKPLERDITGFLQSRSSMHEKNTWIKSMSSTSREHLHLTVKRNHSFRDYPRRGNEFTRMICCVIYDNLWQRM